VTILITLSTCIKYSYINNKYWH